MYAVVACSSCRQPWLIELRHASVACPSCGTRADTRRRRRLWEGADVREGMAAAAHLRAGAGPADPGRPGRLEERLAEPRIVRHDDPVDAAAAKARTVRNPSRRADEVALWLTRLLGDVQHDVFLDALGRSGLDAARAEKEVVRMLACDVIFEPRAGHYRALAT